MKNTIIISIMAVVIGLAVSAANASWLIYHKPEFKGKVIDAETKEPIEGAVVVVVYNKYNFGYPAGGCTTIVKVKETLTEKNGEFYFPSYTTIIQPLSREDYATFIIYKLGYKGFPSSCRIIPLSDLPGPVVEAFFSEGPIGKKGEIRYGDPVKIFKIIFGVVELPEVKTKSVATFFNIIPKKGYRMLVITPKEAANFQLSSRNIFISYIII